MQYTQQQIFSSLVNYLVEPSDASREAYDARLIETLNDFVRQVISNDGKDNCDLSAAAKQTILQRLENYIASPVSSAANVITNLLFEDRLRESFDSGKENGRFMDSYALALREEVNQRSAILQSQLMQEALDLAVECLQTPDISRASRPRLN